MDRIKKIVVGDHKDVGLGNKFSRHQWIERTLKNIPSGYKLLDAGAGEQQFKKFCSHLHYTSQDFAEYDGSGDGKGIQTEKWDTSQLDIISDICSLPVPNSTFDAVLCTEVLEHVPDPGRAITELVRVLRSGGQLIITAPFGSLTHFAPFHFTTGFNKYYYQHWMRILGCEILELVPNGNYFEWIAQEVRYAETASKTYGAPKMSLIEKWAQRYFLSYLKRCASASPSSDELACFGFHLIARKL
ncbi:MAG: methyltransferase domain-containing protein [Bacteroidia bacterium]|nr:methyltransferase domain-containing protein [Bacteroidia bacterium]